MKFRFKLQKLLDYRIRIEEEKKTELGKVQSRINLQNTVIMNAKERKKKLLELKREKATEGILNKTESSLRIMMFQGIERKIKSANEKIEGAQEELKKARRNYFEARKERKKLDKLKERKKSEFKIEARRHELKKLSEMSSQIYIRRHS